MQDNTLSLYELNRRIRESINSTFNETYWVVAEISELNENRSGHCYLELIEKNKDTDEIIARSRATIWSNTYRMLKPYFESATGNVLSAGIKILVNVSVTYHELYSLSLNIKDIDPAYTIGDLAKKRQEIIRKLEKEGVINMNKELVLGAVPRKIAIISSASAAGYGDFINQVENNPYGYIFYCKLFSAYMQGSEAPASIIRALEYIYRYESFFDAVIIIRGGGSQADLSCFDNYDLAYHITQFPLPVISGIGHERDDTILDIVAHTKVKTPTAAAEMLISRVADFENYLDDCKNRFVELTRETLLHNRQFLENSARILSPEVSSILEKKNTEIQTDIYKLENLTGKLLLTEYNGLNNYINTLRSLTTGLLTGKDHKLDIFSNTIEYVDPQNVLKRGYSITTLNRKIIKNADILKENDILETQFMKGRISSKVMKNGR